MILTPPNVFGTTTSGLEYGEFECWISPAARYWLGVASTSLAKTGYRRWRRQVTGALASGTDIMKGIKDQELKSVFDGENTSANSQSTSLSRSMAEGVHLGSCISNAISRRGGGSRAQTHKNEER